MNRIVVQEEELLAPAMIPEGHLQKCDLFKLTYQMCCIYFPATSHLWWHTDMHIRVEEQAALILCGLNYIENISLKSEQYFAISRRCTLRTRRTKLFAHIERMPTVIFLMLDRESNVLS